MTDHAPDPEIRPTAGVVPNCTREACPAFDGKRCRLTGFEPDSVCEPAVIRMAGVLDRIRTACAAGRSGVDDWSAEDAVASVIRDRDHLSEVHERFRVAAIGPGFHEPPITTEDAVIGEIERLRNLFDMTSRARALLAAEVAAMLEWITTTADENFGPFPVQPVDASMAAIGRGIFELRGAVEKTIADWNADQQRLLAANEKLTADLAGARSGWTRSSGAAVDLRREADAEKLARIAAIRERDEARAELAKVKAALVKLQGSVAEYTGSSR